MIQAQSRLRIVDNSGAQSIQCIKVLGGSKRKVASIGDVIIASVKETIPRSKIKKGEVVKALIVRTKKEISRKDGFCLKFDHNAAILLNNQYLPIGTRIFGPISNELRKKQFMKIISLANMVV